jgi:hypothetical protein
MDSTFDGVHFIVDAGGFLRPPGSNAPSIGRISTSTIVVTSPGTGNLPHSTSINNAGVQRNHADTGSGRERQKRRRDLRYEAINRAAGHSHQQGERCRRVQLVRSRNRSDYLTRAPYLPATEPLAPHASCMLTLTQSITLKRHRICSMTAGSSSIFRDCVKSLDLVQKQWRIR